LLDKDRIFTHFKNMCGLDEAAARPLRPLCDVAAQYLVTRLRPEIRLDANMDRLCIAAAALACGDWLELGGSLSPAQELRVGDITLRESSGGSAPRGSALREHFLTGISDLLEPRFVIAGAREDAEEETS